MTVVDVVALATFVTLLVAAGIGRLLTVRRQTWHEMTVRGRSPLGTPDYALTPDYWPEDYWFVWWPRSSGAGIPARSMLLGHNCLIVGARGI